MQDKFKQADEAYSLGYTKLDEENLTLSNGKYTVRIDKEICEHIKGKK